MANCLQRFLLLVFCGHVISLVIADYYSYDVPFADDELSIANFEQDHDRTVRQVHGPEEQRPAKVLDVEPTGDPEDEYSDVGITLPSTEVPKVHHYYHYYYNSTVYMEKEKWVQYWVDLDTAKDKTIHVMLSNTYRKGITLNLSFEFPFYGHLLQNITVTTGGFLFTGAQVHSWLAATQYIAPLMANFDPSITNDSLVKYADNGTAFTVQWENVQLKDTRYAGNFTFQVTLLKSGDIIFVYRDVPISVMTINDSDHPVKIGVSDAYIIDRTIFFLRRKTIYEYHRVDLRKPEIANTTSIYFTALPTCVSLKDCNSCLTAEIGFECFWCIGRCSDGMDRHRQSWITEGCGQKSESEKCPEVHTEEPDPQHRIQPEGGPYFEPSTVFTTQNPFLHTVSTTRMTLSIQNTTISPDIPSKDRVFSDPAKGSMDYNSLSTAGVIIILFVVSMVLAFVGWVVYAYKYPQTPSGQLLIKYRPSQWAWPKGEARYTAASVHM